MASVSLFTQETFSPEFLQGGLHSFSSPLLLLQPGHLHITNPREEISGYSRHLYPAPVTAFCCILKSLDLNQNIFKITFFLFSSLLYWIPPRPCRHLCLQREYQEVQTGKSCTQFNSAQFFFTTTNGLSQGMIPGLLLYYALLPSTASCLGKKQLN